MIMTNEALASKRQQEEDQKEIARLEQERLLNMSDEEKKAIADRILKNWTKYKQIMPDKKRLTKPKKTRDSIKNKRKQQKLAKKRARNA